MSEPTAPQPADYSSIAQAVADGVLRGLEPLREDIARLSQDTRDLTARMVLATPPHRRQRASDLNPLVVDTVVDIVRQHPGIDISGVRIKTVTSGGEYPTLNRPTVTRALSQAVREGKLVRGKMRMLGRAGNPTAVFAPRPASGDPADLPQHHALFPPDSHVLTWPATLA